MIETLNIRVFSIFWLSRKLIWGSQFLCAISFSLDFIPVLKGICFDTCLQSQFYSWSAPELFTSFNMYVYLVAKYFFTRLAHLRYLFSHSRKRLAIFLLFTIIPIYLLLLCLVTVKFLSLSSVILFFLWDGSQFKIQIVWNKNNNITLGLLYLEWKRMK